MKGSASTALHVYVLFIHLTLSKDLANYHCKGCTDTGSSGCNHMICDHPGSGFCCDCLDLPMKIVGSMPYLSIPACSAILQELF